MKLRITALAIALVAVGCSAGSRATSTSSVTAASTTPVASTVATPITSATTVAPPSSSAPAQGKRRCWPIVLVHGTPGFRQLGPVEYFFGIPDRLRQHGFEVLVVERTVFASIEQRGRELRDQILAKYPDPRVKVNVVGHGMGGIDARHAITTLKLGDRVASLTTIASPHHGATISDVIFGLAPGPAVALANQLVGTFGWDLKGLEQLTTRYMTQTFNPMTPDDPRVSYFSWTGVADPAGRLNGCVLEPVLLPGWKAIDAIDGPNDGLVGERSTRWGVFMGVLPADHLHQINQPLGTTGGFDAPGFYLEWAEELEARRFGP